MHSTKSGGLGTKMPLLYVPFYTPQPKHEVTASADTPWFSPLLRSCRLHFQAPSYSPATTAQPLRASQRSRFRNEIDTNAVHAARRVTLWLDWCLQRFQRRAGWSWGVGAAVYSGAPRLTWWDETRQRGWWRGDAPMGRGRWRGFLARRHRRRGLVAPWNLGGSANQQFKQCSAKTNLGAVPWA
jgi:hypothetical protein